MDHLGYTITYTTVHESDHSPIIVLNSGIAALNQGKLIQHPRVPFENWYHFGILLKWRKKG